MLVAYSRPFWPLFLHVLGAMTLFGAVLTTALVSVVGGRVPVARRAALSSLLVALPAWAVTLIGAYWIASNEGLNNSNATWIGLGHVILEGGLLLLLAAAGCAWWWVRSGKPAAGRLVAGLSAVYLGLLTVAMLAMSGKWG